MCQLTSQMKPNSAQMIDVVNTKTGAAPHDGRSTFAPSHSAMLVNHVIRCVRCAQPTYSITAPITIAAIVKPITWLSPAPRAGGSASRRVRTTVYLPPRGGAPQVGGRGSCALLSAYNPAPGAKQSGAQKPPVRQAGANGERRIRRVH